MRWTPICWLSGKLHAYWTHCALIYGIQNVILANMKWLQCQVKSSITKFVTRSNIFCRRRMTFQEENSALHRKFSMCTNYASSQKFQLVSSQRISNPTDLPQSEIYIIHTLSVYRFRRSRDGTGSFNKCEKRCRDEIIWRSKF